MKVDFETYLRTSVPDLLAAMDEAGVHAAAAIPPCEVVPRNQAVARAARGHSRLIGVPMMDPRLPAPGATVTREYRGHLVEDHVTEDGFEYDGRPYDSLSAISKAITGSNWNGYHFFAGALENAERAAS